MKKITLAIILLFCALCASAWGTNGHRIVGEIASRHLTKKAKRNIKKVLKNESVAMVSNWMDFIRSDERNKYTETWHYVSVPDGKSYDSITHLPEGDVIMTIERLVKELKTKEFSERDEDFALRCLIHLVGDIHQPLHVGREEDAGGNKVKVRWFGDDSNLHRVWDADLIDFQKLSYTEYTEVLDIATTEQIKTWQNSTVRDWAAESMSYREAVYQLPEDKKLGYHYNYAHIRTVELRLLQAGIRLAKVLNEIYG